MSRGAGQKKAVCPELVGLSGPFTKIARAMSQQWNVRIVPSGSECSTDGNVIKIPFTSDLLPPEKRQILHGMLDHEICHVGEEQRHKEAGRVSPIALFRAEPDSKLKMLINVFEDIRIEQRYESIYPGMAQNIAAQNIDAAGDWARNYQSRTESNFWGTFGAAIICRARRLEDAWTREGEIAEWMGLIEEEIAESQLGGEWVETAIDLAKRVYAKVKDRLEEKKREKERSKDGDDEGGEGGENSKVDDDNHALGSAEEDPDVEDFADRGRTEMSKYVIEDAKNFDRYIPHPKAARADEVVTAIDHGSRYYDEAKAEVMAQIQGLRSKQRMLIMSWSRRRLRTGLESGFVDDDALSEVRTGNRHVFADVRKKRTLNTAITGLVDCSGSMGPNNHPQACAYYAFRTAIALAESWASLNIANEWLGYTVSDFREVGIMAADLDGPFFCRPPLRHMVFKSFAEPLKAVRGRFGSIQGHGSNVDGEAVAWAAGRLAARPEQRKILVVICDGRPATWNACHEPGADRIVDFGRLQDHLRYVIKSVTSAGIEVICIGAGTPAPGAFYNDSTGAKFVHISNIQTMAMDIFRVMKTRITKGAKSC